MQVKLYLLFPLNMLNRFNAQGYKHVLLLGTPPLFMPYDYMNRVI